MKIFITGGAGYVGSRLVPELLRSGHSVTVFDLMIYGENVLDSHKNLRKIKGDIRDISLLEKNLEDHDAVIHLACISNDPSYELNPKLGKSINFDAFEPFLKLCVKKNIYRPKVLSYGDTLFESIPRQKMARKILDNIV